MILGKKEKELLKGLGKKKTNTTHTMPAPEAWWRWIHGLLRKREMCEVRMMGGMCVWIDADLMVWFGLGAWSSSPSAQATEA